MGPGAAFSDSICFISVILVVFHRFFIGDSDLDETTWRHSITPKRTLDNSVVTLDDVRDTELLSFVVVKGEVDGAFRSIYLLSTIISLLCFDTIIRYK